MNIAIHQLVFSSLLCKITISGKSTYLSSIARTASKWCTHSVSSAAQHCSGPAALCSNEEGWVASIHPPSEILHRHGPEVSQLICTTQQQHYNCAASSGQNQSPKSHNEVQFLSWQVQTKTIAFQITKREKRLDGAARRLRSQTKSS